MYKDGSRTKRIEKYFYWPWTHNIGIKMKHKDIYDDLKMKKLFVSLVYTKYFSAVKVKYIDTSASVYANSVKPNSLDLQYFHWAG